MHDPYTWAGRVVCWAGPQDGVQEWGIGQMAAAARRLRLLGVDTLSVKRGEGTVKWYNTPAQLRAERAAVLDQGAGYIPHFYSDGPKFGPDFVKRECDVILEILDVCGSVVVDMEIEWDNASTEAATNFVDALKNAPGLIYLNSWADPAQQGWAALARELDAVAAAWVPMQYNNWLAQQEGQLAGLHALQPGLDLTQEFGANDPLAIAQQARARGHNTVWLWDYGYAMKAPALVRSIVGAMGEAPPPVAPPAPAPRRLYTVVAGDTLSAIAQREGVSLTDLEQANKETIAAACAEHGVAFSYDDIWPGMGLVLP